MLNWKGERISSEHTNAGYSFFLQNFLAQEAFPTENWQNVEKWVCLWLFLSSWAEIIESVRAYIQILAVLVIVRILHIDMCTHVDRRTNYCSVLVHWWGLLLPAATKQYQNNIIHRKHWQKQWPSNRKPLGYSQLDTVLSTIDCLKQTNRFRVNLADPLLFRVKAKQHLIKMQYIYKLNTLSPNPGPIQFFIHSCTMPNRKST